MNTKKNKLAFNEFIEDISSFFYPDFQDSNRLKTAILFQVFFYSLFESGILYYRENILPSNSDFSLKDYPTDFHVPEAEKIKELFIPDMYFRISEFIINHLGDLPVYLLTGFFYENLVSRIFSENPEKDSFDKSIVRNNGIFYTPPVTAENFIAKTLEHWHIENKNISEIKVLDLACGCGIFSIIVLKKISETYLRKNIKPGENSRYATAEIMENFSLKNQTTISRLDILKNNIYAVDNDETALQISRFSLLLFSLFEEKNFIALSQFIRMWNSLGKNICNFDIFGFYRNDVTRNRHFAEQKFDIVVSNPPYISYYSRYSRSTDSIDKILPIMKKNMLYVQDLDAKEKSSGRLNSSIFFLDYAIRSLSPGGCLGFLTDMNIHENLFSNIRKWILRNLTLLETQVNICDFPGVNSGQSFIYLQNTLPEDQDSKNHDVKIIDQKNHETYCISRSTLKNQASFFVKRNPEFLDSLNNLPVLGDYCRISTGVNIGGVSEQFLNPDNPAGKLYPMITPDRLKKPYSPIQTDYSLYMDFSKEKADLINLKFRNQNKKNVIALGKLQRFLEPRLFVRQSAPRIIATYCEQPLVSPYSIFVINQSADALKSYSLDVLLAILNSNLISMYSLQKGYIRQGNGKQPQIRKASLQLIPVPDENSYCKYKPEIEYLVRQIRKNQEPCEKKTPINLTANIIEIEKLVCSMYNVNYEWLAKATPDQCRN